MPILLDLSQIAISNLMMSPNINTGDVDGQLIKHMVLNSIRGYKKKFGHEYGQIVVCCDAKHYWRKDVFPHYKAHRKAARQKSKIDWKEVFNAIDELKVELKENFPYKVVEVPLAEGDDVIGIIAMNEDEPTIIIGSDKDYGQLHGRPNVRQYSPTAKKFIEIENAQEFLNELIIRGDKDDGIPNIKSDSDTFVLESKRQKNMKSAEVAQWKKCTDPKQFCETRMMLENFKRNKELIDFKFIPERVSGAILNSYAQPALGSKSKILNYFIANGMKMLAKDLGQF